MKRILTLLLIAAGLSASAQHTAPRYSNPPSGNNSATTINFYLYSVHDSAGATTDTLEFRPNYQTSNFKVSLADSASLRLKSLAGCYFNDIVTLDITSTVTAPLYLVGNWVVSTGTNKLSLTASKKSLLVFRFDGSKYIEISRNLNY